MALVLALYGAVAAVVFWMVPRSLRRSEPPLRRSEREFPSTVPREWVDEFRDGG